MSRTIGSSRFGNGCRHLPSPQRRPSRRSRASSRTIASAATVLQTLRKTPLFVAPGTTEAASAHIRNLAARLRLVNQQIKEAHQALDGLCARLEAATESPSGQNCEQRDVTILRSWPGIGRIVLATLLTEATEPLRARDYHALRALAGTAPVTRRSGKQCFVIRRHACSGRLQTAIYHWSRVAIQHDAVARRRYDALRRRGHGHARALRSVGDRLLYALCTTLERQMPYNPNCQDCAGDR